MNRLLVAALVLTLAACTPAATPTPAPEAPTLAPPEPTPVPPTEAPPAQEPPTEAPPFIDMLAIYTNEPLGYAFDYPDGWQVTGDDATALYLTSFDLTAGAGGHGIPEGETKIDFVFVQDFDSLEAMLASDFMVNSREELQDVVDTELTLAGDTPALQTRARGQFGDEVNMLVTVINGHGLIVAGYGDLSFFNAVARSLRPAS